MRCGIFLVLGCAFLAICPVQGVPSPGSTAGPLNPEAKEKANRIIDFLVNGAGKGQSWDKLSTFVDTIGSRVSGSVGLDNAVRYMLDVMKSDGLENVHGEAVTIPKWVSKRWKMLRDVAING